MAAKTDFSGEYKKARVSLQHRIARAKKKGFSIPENIVPAIPSVISKKSLRDLQRSSKKLSQIIRSQTPQQQSVKTESIGSGSLPRLSEMTTSIKEYNQARSALAAKIRTAKKQGIEVRNGVLPPIPNKKTGKAVVRIQKTSAKLSEEIYNKRHADTIAEYNKIRRSLLQKISRAKKRGYYFPDDLVPDIPKRKTRKSVEELKKISSDLYKNAQYVEKSTGELFSGEEGRKIEKYRSQRKALETKKSKRTRDIEREFYGKEEPYTDNTGYVETIGATLDWVEQELANWEPAPHWNDAFRLLKQNDRRRLDNILKDAINRLGRKQVAENIQNEALAVQAYVMQVLYGSGDGGRSGFLSGRAEVDNCLTLLASIFKGGSVTVEESKYLTEYGEDFEV